MQKSHDQIVNEWILEEGVNPETWKLISVKTYKYQGQSNYVDSSSNRLDLILENEARGLKFCFSLARLDWYGNFSTSKTDASWLPEPQLFEITTKEGREDAHKKCLLTRIKLHGADT